MRVIYKYLLLYNPEGRILLSLPNSHRILRSDVQNDKIYIWVLLNPDPSLELKQKEFYVLPTGHKVNDSFAEKDYIDAVFLDNGEVYHIFSEK